MLRGFALASLAAALVIGAPRAAEAQERITVTAYTGPWEIAQRACFMEPFTKATGIEVVVETGTASVTFTKLRQQKGSPAIDVAWVDAGYSEMAWDEGLTDPIEPTATPNLAGLDTAAVYRAKDGKIYAVGTGFFSYALVFDPKIVKPAPNSWFDLWKPEYANRVYAPAPAQAMFAPLLMHLNKFLGGDNSNFNPVIQKFKELKPSSYYESSGVVQASIQSGEAIFGIYYPNTAWQLADQGVSIATATPKEGLPASDIRLHLVKGSKNKAAAEKFINFALQPEALNCLAEKIFVGPPLKSPTLSEKAKQRMPWGASGSLKDLSIPDWREVNAKRQDVVNLWNRQVLGR